MPGTLIKAVLKKMMEDNTDAGPVAEGHLDGATVRLIQEEFTESADLAWGDLVEADFSGYAASSAIVWTDGLLDNETELYKVQGDAKVFNCTGATLNTIYGAAIVTDDGTPLLVKVEHFDAPIEVPNGGSLTILPTVSLAVEDQADSSMLVAS